jgi:hypothetical protein
MNTNPTRPSWLGALIVLGSIAGCTRAPYDPGEITKVGDALRKIAEADGGEYDGWGSAVVF